MHSNTSYVLEEDEHIAIEMINELLGNEPIPNLTNNLAVKLYILGDDVSILKDEEGNEKRIVIPPSVQVDERFRTVAALVIGVGPECYKGDRFKDTGPWVRVGDWIMIPRHAGIQKLYKEIPMHIIHCEKFFCVLKDPTYVYKKR